jgi:hypothetical protein
MEMLKMENKDTKSVPAETKLTKNESTPATQAQATQAPATSPTLSPEILAAIAATVQAAMQPVLEMLTKPTTAPRAPTPPAAMQESTTHYGNGSPKPNTNTWVSKLKGIPVEEGQDMRHVKREVIQGWFSNVEQRWKEKVNSQRAGGQPVNMNWTRG